MISLTIPTDIAFLVLLLLLGCMPGAFIAAWYAGIAKGRAEERFERMLLLEDEQEEMQQCLTKSERRLNELTGRPLSQLTPQAPPARRPAGISGAATLNGHIAIPAAAFRGPTEY